jgi:hypothetical protein
VLILCSGGDGVQQGEKDVSIIYIMRNRRVFITQREYGLGPADAKVDDGILVLLGEDIPFVPFVFLESWTGKT